MSRSASIPGPGRAGGKVYLVGAGPGDPDLITVRGIRCVRRADVVVHDRLVHPDLVAEAPPAAERVFAGKAPGFEALSQEEINALMIDRARAGATVVRLKGGDPFVFGRGAEEALALAEAGVSFEVVSGPTSAVTVAGGALIPVTHRDASVSFAVVTGHRAGDPDGDDATGWEALASVDTLIVLMGVRKLEEIVGSLLAHGRAPDTPACIVERGTLPEERIVSAPLAELPRIGRGRSVSSPAVIVVGEVVRVGARLRALVAGSVDPGGGRRAAAAVEIDRG